MNPSQEFETYWIYAKNKNIKYPKETINCGKWLIFAKKGKILDEIWNSIKILTESGLLGNASKCSTSKENENASNQDYGVICVYTYNSNDKEDLKRIAKELFKINEITKLFYKEDNATYEGKYANKGNKNISKWVVTKENFMEVLK